MGIKTFSPAATLDIAGDIALSAIATLAVSSFMNNVPVNGQSVLRIESTGTGSGNALSGFSGGVAGKILYLYHIQTKGITIEHLGTNSASQNQIFILNGGDLPFPGNFSATFIYDGTLSKWILLHYF